MYNVYKIFFNGLSISYRTYWVSCFSKIRFKCLVKYWLRSNVMIIRYWVMLHSYIWVWSSIYYIDYLSIRYSIVPIMRRIQQDLLMSLVRSPCPSYFTFYRHLGSLTSFIREKNVTKGEKYEMDNILESNISTKEIILPSSKLFNIQLWHQKVISMPALILISIENLLYFWQVLLRPLLMDLEWRSYRILYHSLYDVMLLFSILDW